MIATTRRGCLAGLLGAAATSVLPNRLGAQSTAAAIPPEGIGHNIRHLSYSDQGGRPDGVQVMLNRGYVYVGHMFNDGLTVLDASDPRALKPVHFLAAAPNTRTHHLQVAGDYMLLANGANIVRMQSYDSARDYFENTLADSLSNELPFRADSRSTTSQRTRPSRARSHSSSFQASASIASGGPASATPMSRLIWMGSQIRYCASSTSPISRGPNSSPPGGCPACTARPAKRRATGPARGTRFII